MRCIKDHLRYDDDERKTNMEAERDGLHLHLRAQQMHLTRDKFPSTSGSEQDNNQNKMKISILNQNVSSFKLTIQHNRWKYCTSTFSVSVAFFSYPKP